MLGEALKKIETLEEEIKNEQDLKSASENKQKEAEQHVESLANDQTKAEVFRKEADKQIKILQQQLDVEREQNIDNQKAIIEAEEKLRGEIKCKIQAEQDRDNLKSKLRAAETNVQDMQRDVEKVCLDKEMEISKRQETEKLLENVLTEKGDLLKALDKERDAMIDFKLKEEKRRQALQKDIDALESQREEDQKVLTKLRLEKEEMLLQLKQEEALRLQAQKLAAQEIELRDPVALRIDELRRQILNQKTDYEMELEKQRTQVEVESHVEDHRIQSMASKLQAKSIVLTSE